MGNQTILRPCRSGKHISSIARPDLRTTRASGGREMRAHARRGGELGARRGGGWRLKPFANTVANTVC
eukprot:4054899-Prymnesium_polylepis.1